MVLELLGRVLLAERRNLVEVHLQVVRHLLRQLVLRGRLLTTAAHLQERHRLTALSDALAVRALGLADAFAVRALLRRDQHRLRLRADALAVRTLRLADACAVRALLLGLADALAVRALGLADAFAVRALLRRD